jgi:hypothetical protein
MLARQYGSTWQQLASRSLETVQQYAFEKNFPTFKDTGQFERTKVKPIPKKFSIF